MDVTTLKTGDILLCSGHKLLSDSIQLATRSRLTHTATFLNIHGYPAILDAQKEGVFIRSYYRWLEQYNYDFFVMRGPSEIDEAEFIRKALSITGTRYDKANLLFRQPVKLLYGKWKDKGNREDDKMICNGVTMWMRNFEVENNMFDSYDPEQVFRYLIDKQFNIKGAN